MNDDPKVIIDAGDMAEITDNHDEDSDMSDMTATEKPDETTMDFHIQMRGYTMSDFETYVIEAAAQNIMRNFNRDSMKKDIENRAVVLINEAIDKTLMPITSEFMDQPMLPKYRGKEEVVTLREFVGLCGKDYLTTKVNGKGEVASGQWDRGEPRMNYIIAQIIDKRLKDEISKEVNSMMVDIKAEANKRLNGIINKERERINTALGYEVNKNR